MLTVNDDTEDGLVNGAIGTVKGFRGFRGQKNLLKGEVYVLFDLPEVGCSKKIKKAGMFEGCVAIKAVTRTFTYNKRSKSEILISRKQYPLKFAHAITIHKSQSATYKYMVVDFNRETKSVAYELRFQPGQQYTAFSRGEDRSRIIVKNFNPSMLINVNKKAQDEMKRLQSEMLKDKWCHPLQTMNGFVITQLNIVSWNLHIEHFLSDRIHQSASDIFCFTETHVDSPRVTIEELTNNTWSSVLKNTPHGLGICFKKETVTLIEEIKTLGIIEMLSTRIKCADMEMIISVVYRPSKTSPRLFLEELLAEVRAQPTDVRKVLVGDFNMDQLLKEYEEMVNSFAQQISMVQKVTYSTHKLGGILDLVIDSEPSGSVDWMPTPFSDHFVVYYNVH